MDGTPSFFSRVIVAAQPKGDRRPLFLVHGIGGTAVMFPRLQRYLGLDQPVYALQAKGIDGKQPIQDRIEDMAATYIEAIRGVQAEPPYLIAGYSFGGHVAFEIAREMTESGLDVAMLAILDMSRPSDDPTRVFCQTGSWTDSAPRYSKRFWELIRKGRAKQIWTAVKRRLRAHKRGFNYEKVEDLVEMRHWPQRNQEIAAIHFEALRRYIPSVYPGSIDLFRVPHSPATAEGWEPWIGGEIRVHMITGTHTGMFDEPHAKVLGESLRRQIDQRVLACSPKPDPDVMRVPTGRTAKETHDEGQTEFSARDHSQAPRSGAAQGGRAEHG